jgi:hypothetical protein
MLQFSVAGAFLDNGVLPFPANLPSVVPVAAVSATGSLHLNPPQAAGQQPWFVAPGHNLWTTSFDAANSSVLVHGNSAACALAAGSAALIKSQNPTWPASAILYRMRQTARDMGPIGIDASYGYGMPNPQAALQNNAANGLWELINVSTRAWVGTGSNVAIQGFVVSGSNTKRVLLRGVGGTLAQQIPGTLANPFLTLRNSSGQVLYSNDNWGTQSNAQEIASVAETYGAFPLTSSLDAALLVTLPPGLYTAELAGVGGGTGIAMVEAYDVGGNPSAGVFANISTRAYVGTGSGITIPGVVIQANALKKVLLRAVGPTLGALGVSGFVANPQLTVTNSDTGQVEIYNAYWNSAPNVQEIRNAVVQVGAFELLEGSADAAALITLPGGAYTIQISGVSGTTGIVLFEAYAVE